jgi:hypothetical protein
MYPLRVGVTMSIHKLTAGSGYDYLTRQVAALDTTEKGHVGLTSYYTERGESPGVLIGTGLEGIDGLAASDPVTAEQMQALFGCGLHPLTELGQQQLAGPDLSPRDHQEVARLGAPFKIVHGKVSPFRLEVARRYAALRTAADLSAGAPWRPQTGRGCGPGGPRVLPRRAWPSADRRPRVGRTDRERLPVTNPDSRGLRLDVLAGEVSVDPVGDRRPSSGGRHRTRPSGRCQ